MSTTRWTHLLLALAVSTLMPGAGPWGVRIAWGQDEEPAPRIEFQDVSF